MRITPVPNLTGRMVYPKHARKPTKKPRGEAESPWARYGSDEEFLAFVRTLPSAYDGRYDYIDGIPRNQACHYRTAENSGISIKPPYSAISLTAEQHRMQHRVGTFSFMHRAWWEYSVQATLEAWARSKGVEK